MKKELKGFVCGFTAMAVLSVGVASASGFWDTINVLRNDISVVVNGENITADNFLYNDTTYLPLRAVAEAVGKPVDYDAARNIAYLGEKVIASNYKMYDTCKKVPDFGVLADIHTTYINFIDKGVAYRYPLFSITEGNISEYVFALENCGFNFVKETDVDGIITYYYKNDIENLGVIMYSEGSYFFIIIFNV